MENDRRAMSWQQFIESGFDGRDYVFPDFEGSFEAIIACKRWNKSKNLLTYLNFIDGRKIITASWNTSNFHGLADMPIGTKVKVTFKKARSGKSFLNAAEKL